MLCDLLDPLAVDPHLTSIIQAVEIFAAGVGKRRHRLSSKGRHCGSIARKLQPDLRMGRPAAAVSLERADDVVPTTPNGALVIADSASCESANRWTTTLAEPRSQARRRAASRRESRFAGAADR